jgi:hypothetical protein
VEGSVNLRIIQVVDKEIEKEDADDKEEDDEEEDVGDEEEDAEEESYQVGESAASAADMEASAARLRRVASGWRRRRAASPAVAAFAGGCAMKLRAICQLVEVHGDAVVLVTRRRRSGSVTGRDTINDMSCHSPELKKMAYVAATGDEEDDIVSLETEKKMVLCSCGDEACSIVRTRRP